MSTRFGIKMFASLSFPGARAAIDQTGATFVCDSTKSLRMKVNLAPTGTKPRAELALNAGLPHVFFYVMKWIRERIWTDQTGLVRGLVPLTATRFLLLAVFVGLPSFSRAADALDNVEKSAEEWIKLRTETARTESDWQREKALVESMIQAVNQRATAAEEKRDLTQAKTAKEREEIETILAKSQAAQEEFKAAEARLKRSTQTLLALRPHLPPRLSEALEMAYRTLASSDLALGDRMQYVTMILNRCAQFNRLIDVGEDVLTLDGEPPAKSYEVIYWGLSHGYAIDRAGAKAWLGTPSESGWKWDPKPGAFGAVVRLIAVANDKADPAFELVPATVVRALPERSTN